MPGRFPNRTAFLALEGGEMTIEEIWACTRFTRCADCGYVINTPSLVSLPEHRCTQRQALNRAKEAS